MIDKLISDFSNNQLSNFLRNNNSSFVDYLEDFSELISDNEKFTNLYKLGEIEYNNTDKLIVFTCMFIGELTSRSARKTQFELAKKVLKEDFNDGAVFVFYDKAGRFRFSFIRRNYGDRKQKYTPWKRYTYFVEPDAATNRTFKERIGNCKFDSLDTIQEAFSVEKLTKDFYKELSDWYFWAIKNVSFPNNVQDDNDDDKYNPESIIRLITRLIFVWFLKQKGLIRNELFETSFISNTLKEFDPESDTQHNYYRAILQNLFFATLNQEMHKRSFAEDKDFFSNRATNSIKNLYRFENEFKSENASKIMELFKQIPFLNGGLFECLDRKEKDGKIYDWDGFSRNPKFQAKVPNMLFFAKDTKVDLSEVYNDKKFKSVHVAGIIEILNRYNFTVEENTPVEIEVALDPELLGKVFENLLGAYNPETQETARKQTGSFYTPREIVNYMVDESLIAYYRTKVPNVNEESLRLLLSYDEQPVIINESHRELLIQATFDCKILDPACGSGAFPMGVLQQMVHILKKLDPDNTYWNNVVMSQAMCDFEKSEKLSEDDMDEIQKEIEKTFDAGLNYPDYARKLHLIKNCIYGIDIQSIAVQISKLRFFISLVTEQKRNPNAEENFGIKPLPNLETKFVAANTLIGLEKTEEEQVLFSNDHIKKLIDKLQNIRLRQFLVTNSTEKKRLRDKDEKLRLEIENEVSRLYVKHQDDLHENYKIELSLAEKQLSLLNKMPYDIRENTSTDLFGIESTTTYNYTEIKRKEIKGRIKLLNNNIQKGEDYSRLESIVKLAKQLTSWNPYDQNASSPFFDPEWMFGLKKENEGYFDLVIGNPPYIQLKWVKIDYSFQKYKCFSKSSDLYCLFYEKSNILIKNTGTGCFITSNKWLRSDYGKLLRNYFIKSILNLKILDFKGFRIFENATVDTNILLWEKSNSDTTNIKYMQCNSGDLLFNNIWEPFNYQPNEIWSFSITNKGLKNILEKKFKPLRQFPIEFNYGILTGANDAFIIDETRKNKLLEEDNSIKDYFLPILRGKDIEKYWYNFKGYYIINTNNGIKKKNIKPIELNNHDHSALLNYFETFGDKFKSRGEKGDNWYNLRNCAYFDLYKQPKILYSDITKDGGKFYFDEYGFYSNDTAFMIYSKDIPLLKHVTAILNSNFGSYIYKECYCGGLLGDKGLRYKKEFLQNVPIPNISTRLVNCVDELIKIKKSMVMVNEMEYEFINKIDHLVYRLYNLTYDEVKVIDPEIEKKISEVDYNAIEI